MPAGISVPRWIIPLGIAAAALLASAAFAASVFDIDYPIPELGNCADRVACKVYCDDAAHADACIVFARSRGLISESEAKSAEASFSSGPGGCQDAAACRAYCDDPAHAEECIAFAEQHGILGKRELEEARKNLSEAGPGGCRGAEACRAYCSDASHREECLEVAHRKGLVSDQALKAEKILKQSGGPGGCSSQIECKAYCENPDHLEACVSFGVEHDLISVEDARRIRETGLASGPGGCRGAEACRTYCETAEHQGECIEFGEKKGFMTHDQAERARRVAGAIGPGGCQGEVCKTYCDDPEHAEECLAFAEGRGLIKADEAERIKKFVGISKGGGPGGCRGSECRTYCADAAHQDECVAFATSKGLVTAAEAQNLETGAKIRKKISESGGPGGCSSQEACRSYCSDPSHTEACVAFGAAHGGIPEDQARQMLRQFTAQRFDEAGDFRPAEELDQVQQDAEERFQEFKVLEQQFRGGQMQFGPPPGVRSQEGSEGGGQGGVNPAARPGAQGQGESQRNVVGPGGCASGQECISYCATHRNECFGASSSLHGGQEQTRPGGSPQSESGGAPPFGRPQQPVLRSDLIREFKPGELPSNFQNLSPDQREELFRSKFGPESEGNESPGEREGGRGPDQGFPARGVPFRGPGFPGSTGGEKGEREHFQSGPQFRSERPEFHQEGGGVPGGDRGFENNAGPRPGEFSPAPGGGFNRFEGVGPLPGTTGMFGPMQPQNQPPSGSFSQPPASQSFSPQPAPPSSGTFFGTPPPAPLPESAPPPPPPLQPPPPPPPSASPFFLFWEDVAGLIARPLLR